MDVFVGDVDRKWRIDNGELIMESWIIQTTATKRSLPIEIPRDQLEKFCLEPTFRS